MAVIECTPSASDETGSAALPPLKVTVPSSVLESKNCTLPVAVAGDTCAVKVTACPTVDGSTEEIRATEDGALLTV